MFFPRPRHYFAKDQKTGTKTSYSYRTLKTREYTRKQDSPIQCCSRFTANGPSYHNSNHDTTISRKCRLRDGTRSPSYFLRSRADTNGRRQRTGSTSKYEPEHPKKGKFEQAIASEGLCLFPTFATNDNSHRASSHRSYSKPWPHQFKSYSNYRCQTRGCQHHSILNQKYLHGKLCEPYYTPRKGHGREQQTKKQ